MALTKIADYATVLPGVALFALFGLVLLLAAVQSCLDPREVWERIEWAEENVRLHSRLHSRAPRAQREREALP